MSAGNTWEVRNRTGAGKCEPSLMSEATRPFADRTFSDRPWTAGKEQWCGYDGSPMSGAIHRCTRPGNGTCTLSRARGRYPLFNRTPESLSPTLFHVFCVFWFRGGGGNGRSPTGTERLSESSAEVYQGPRPEFAPPRLRTLRRHATSDRASMRSTPPGDTRTSARQHNGRRSRWGRAAS